MNSRPGISSKILPIALFPMDRYADICVALLPKKLTRMYLNSIRLCSYGSSGET